MTKPIAAPSPGRRWLVLAALLAVAAALVGRAVYLQLEQQEFLKRQGQVRFQDEIELAANRGMIVDRVGEPLAVSAPIDTVAINPKRFLANADAADEQRLARALGMGVDEVREKIRARAARSLFYLKRQVTPEISARIKALGIPGVEFEREYRRYYPMAEVTGHAVGFTGIDHRGQEGLELAFGDLLRGLDGRKQVMTAANGQVIHARYLVDPQPGQDLVLSLDRRVQYLAYRELKATVKAHEARSASAVLLDVTTGEVLAMVNQPTFNPNNRATLNSSAYRNRAVTDVFEPGSTVKPITIAAALDYGLISPQTVIDTSPGVVRIDGKVIRDAVNYGPSDVQRILQKSSNVGTSQIALEMSAEQLWKFYSRIGFGFSTGSRFPGEADGYLGDYWTWRSAHQATFSYGYGLSATTLQLARAYATLANDGVMLPVTFLKQNTPLPGEQAVSPQVARSVIRMLESVVSDEGTGKAARVKDYRVAGKTGTVHRIGRDGYAEDRYSSLFVGVAPASRPRLALAVVIHDPARAEYHGGAVAAPAFSRIMTGALRLLNIAPDDLPPAELRQATLSPDPEWLRPVSGGGRW